MVGDSFPGKSAKQLEREARDWRLSQVRQLLAANFTDKEIANRLGIGVNRARKDVAFIRGELGFSDRRSAARHLSDILGVRDVPGEPPTLYEPTPTSSFVSPAEEAGSVNRVMEERAVYHARRQSPDIGLPFRAGDGRRNTLSAGQRWIWIALVASIAFTAMGLMSLGIVAIR
jgi:hypothetical protein